jgi:hypothetical protein
MSLKLSAQSREDSIHLARQSGKWIDLDFTAAEADSLLESLQDYRQAYVSMHALPISYQLRFPFSFDPAPRGFKLKTKQNKNEFPLEKTKLPANLD